MYHSFFLHSSVDGHLGCFHVLAIANCAAVNNGIHVSFSILVSSEYMPRSGTAGSYGGFISVFLRDRHTIFYNGCINLHSHQQCKSGHSLFCISSPAFIVCRLFDDGHSDWYEEEKNGLRRNLPLHSKGHIWQAYSKHYSQWWRTESIPPKIRKKARVSTFPTIIQHSSGSPSYSNQRRKRNKRNPDWKRKSKALTLSDDMIRYIENPKDSIRKLLELISELAKLQGPKSIQITCISIY